MGAGSRRSRRGAAGHRWPRVLRPLPADGAALPPPPPLEARGDDRHRALGHGARRVDPPIRRAHLRDPRRSRRPGRAGLARHRALQALRPGPRSAPSHRRGGHRRPRAGAANARLRLQHAPPGQGDQGPAALVPPLARRPQPLQRGVRRVRAGAGGGGEGALRPGSPLVRDQGEAARARPPRRLRPDGRGHLGRRGGPVGGRAGSGDRLLLLVLGAGGGRRRALLRRALDRRPAHPRQARRSLQCLDRPLGPPLCAPQLHRQAPGRDDARARARPRAPPDPGQGTGHLPPGHAADRRRDGVGVRRGDHLRPAAGARRDPRVAAQPARRGGRGTDRDRLPSDRDEPVRGPRPHGQEGRG